MEAKEKAAIERVAIQLKDGDCLPFKSLSERLGRAEFVICPQYKNGKLVKLYINPAQQEDINYYYVWEGIGKSDFTIQSYQKLDDPKVWMFHYCKEHKCQSLRLYVPADSNYLWFNVFSNNISIGFLKDKI
jgi:hypothetical protein